MDLSNDEQCSSWHLTPEAIDHLATPLDRAIERADAAAATTMHCEYRRRLTLWSSDANLKRAKRT
jgi:hypothetical protein